MGYDLDQFFRVTTKLELPGGTTVYLRTLSDWETRQRTEAALVASTKKRRELRDSESMAHATYVEPIGFGSEEDLRNTISSLESRNIARDVVEEMPTPYIPFPDDASLEERQDVVDKRVKAEETAQKRRTKAIEARVKKLEKTLAKKKKAHLVGRCKTAQIKAQALVAYVEEWNRQGVFYSCFKDENRTERFFESPEEAGNLPPIVYGKFLAEYATIDRAQSRDLETFFQGRHPPADG